MSTLARLSILLTLAWRSLYSHKAKNAIVGLIIGLGSMLVVLGTSLLDSIDRGMQHSITASIAGHLQVYDANARDELALFGGVTMSMPEIGSIPDFKKVKTALEAAPNVAAVVPLGMYFAEFYTSTEFDRAIEALRSALRAGTPQQVAAHQQRIRSMAALLREQFVNLLQYSSDRVELQRQLADIETVGNDAFWARLATEADRVVEFLDTKIAPLVDAEDALALNYLGTDIALFAKSFDTFEVVEGQLVPPGERGLMINQTFMQDVVRNRIARDLDALKLEIIDRGKRIAADPLLQARVDRMVRQYRRITFQLDPVQADALARSLRALMPEAQGNVDELMQAFLRVDDGNFSARLDFFNREIGPRIRLYPFGVGDVITIQSYTRSGYPKAQNIKIWGVFRFKGLEKSMVAGAYNLMDMVSFRELYGQMTEDKRKELAGLQAEVGARDIKAEEAEAALFGAGQQIEQQQKAGAGISIDERSDLRQTRLAGRVIDASRFDPKTLDDGLALNAAVLLKDASNVELSALELQRVADEHQLGVRVVTWQKASGMVGQLVILVRIILYVAIFIIFLVALVIINNTMILATMERTTEIGTIRAIGGQRLFVRVLFLLETLILGAVAALIGTFVGAGLVGWLGQVGLPAVHDVLTFLFSGPRLFPTYGLWNLITAWLAILGVSLLATFYPAFLATRIQPAVAMQTRE